jgi:3'-phosphoadenosine 5'-phosphosulfate sulfotransferase (PAPS reductase)/FAD synthetase
MTFEQQMVAHDRNAYIWGHVEELVSRATIDRMLREAVKEIRNTVGIRKAAYGWSGGLDSQALRIVCELAGIKDCVSVITSLEFSKMLSWLHTNAPEKCTFVNTGQDLAWLARHIKMLFPADSQISSRWYRIVQHEGQEQYARGNGVRIMILGRLRSERNFCGDRNGVYEARGLLRYSPLRHWETRHTTACAYYYGLGKAPCYDTPRGWYIGTGAWAMRPSSGDAMRDWREVYEVEPEIVKKAAATGYFRSAELFLESAR